MAEGKTTSHKSLEDFDPQMKPQSNKFAFACAILASMTSILLGYGRCSGYKSKANSKNKVF
jgi:hypothetical protein